MTAAALQTPDRVPGPGLPPDPAGGLLDAAQEILHAVLALPEPGTPWARSVDQLQYVEFVSMWVLGLILFGFTGWFIVRYRRRGDAPPATTPKVTAPAWLELSVGGVLLALFLAWWVVGFGQYARAEISAEGAYPVYVTAKQWTWKFDYPEGRSTAGVLYLPAGRDVRLLLTSRDVIHSFYVPDFRLKRDAVPGRYQALNFRPTTAGRHRVLCAELCGTGHSRMWAEVVVLPPERFERWLSTGLPGEPGEPVADPPILGPGEGGREEPIPGASLADRGRRAAVRLGCLGCHTVDGSPHLAPTWRGLFGSDEVMEDGDTVRVTAGYVTESMMDPEARIVAGYPPIMPSFQGQVRPAEAAAIVEYMRTLASGEAPERVPARAPPVEDREPGVDATGPQEPGAPETGAQEAAEPARRGPRG